MSYLSGIYFESWFSWLGEGSQKTLGKRRKQTEEKHSKMKRKKNEGYKESQITTINIFGFTFYIENHILFKSTFWRKVVYAITFTYSSYVLQNIWNAVMIEQSLKYRNCNVREIHMNRLNTATQILIAMDYLILLSEKYLHFRKRQKHVARKVFSHPVEVTGSMYFRNLEWNWNNSGCIKVDNFC